MFDNFMSRFDGEKLEGKFLPAIVVDNNDPDKQGKAKLRVYTLNQGHADDNLMWSMSMDRFGQGNSSAIAGINPPAIGSKVWKFFPHDDEHNTYYIGAVLDAGTRFPELLVDYPNCYGYIDRSGNLFLTNTIKNTVTAWYKCGTKTVVDNETGDLTHVVANNYNLKIGGSLNVDAAQAINLNAPQVNINSGPNAASNLQIQTRQRPVDTPFNNKTDY